MSAAPTDQARAVLRAVLAALNDPHLVQPAPSGAPVVVASDLRAVLRGLAAQYGIDDLDGEQ